MEKATLLLWQLIVLFRGECSTLVFNDKLECLWYTCLFNNWMNMFINISYCAFWIIGFVLMKTAVCVCQMCLLSLDIWSEMVQVLKRFVPRLSV